MLLSCDGSSGKTSPSSIKTDSVKKEEEQKVEPVPEPLIIKYKLDSIVSTAHRDSIFGFFSEKEERNILLLNRIEKNRIKAGTRLVIPDTLFEDFLKYSPFPQEMPYLDSIPKTLLIAQRIQAFALYEKGRLIHWGPVSSGKQSTPTPNGLNYANFKSKRKVSTVDPDWIMPYYFNFMNFYGVGVHQYLLPGYPASHACVRLDMEDAKFIFDWAVPWKLDSRGRYLIKNGTPFMVFGEYNFNAQVPWLDLANNPDANKLNEGELGTIKKYVEDYMADEKNFEKKEITKEENLLGA
ncbi:L,D-transpeptidase family protein [Antarcticibacterium arcticum]|uniref:L,D-transpeptidase family protein n=2 Tax=Antarcticibacterium arcticum TaxID=2585771 RepID=A0A5B8YM47_9FLAO|nr:L,D-transpeptidase family protein [Antarcticibacterium arcticum]